MLKKMVDKNLDTVLAEYLRDGFVQDEYLMMPTGTTIFLSKPVTDEYSHEVSLFSELGSDKTRINILK